MYTTIAEFLADWEYESGTTIKTFHELTDGSLAQRVTPSGRSLGKIAWHIVATVGEMMQAAGIRFDAPVDDKAVPSSASEIESSYKRANESFIAALPAQWHDENLSDEIEMYGQKFTKGNVLVMLVKHQIHHRAQLTVLMRQAGLRVPGAYGPSQEEWALFGAEAAE